MDFNNIKIKTLEKAIKLSINNSKNFYFESNLLFKMRNYGHSMSLAILGVEEFGKAVGYILILQKKKIPIEGRLKYDPNDILKRIQKDHKTKHFLFYINSILEKITLKDKEEIIKINFKEKTINSKTLESYGLKVINQNLNDFFNANINKQNGFYVEIDDNEIIYAPNTIRSNDAKYYIKLLKNILDVYEA